MTKEVVLFEQKKDCCGCGACANRCPRDAIQMCPDEFGFRYPVIRTNQCVGCGLCVAVCRFRGENEAPLTVEAYAVQARDATLLERSASGGMFAVLAQTVLETGGVVAGCALERTDDGLIPSHVLIESLTDLDKIQGSKYVQSVTGDIYRRVCNVLETGRQVLFSGTPCQVEGLKGYLGKPYPNFLTVDLVCHGTPSDALFRDYIRGLEKKYKGKVTEFKFRDKSDGWGLNGSVTLCDQSGNQKKRFFPAEKSSYYNLFLNAEIYRSSCYHCKFACMRRSGDLTVGDFWGFESQHPECLCENGGSLAAERGISCLLVNSAKGKAVLEKISGCAEIVPTRLETVARENRQLNHPSIPGENREKILQLYRNSGYPAIEAWFVRHHFVKRCMRKIKHLSGRFISRESK